MLRSTTVRDVFRTILPIASIALLLSTTAWAQGTQGASTLTGAVRDASGLVLPGVTVTATSDALIEGARTVATDGQGRYTIINLRAGTYTLTFTLSGFSTVSREEIELPSGFSATINADLRVGNVEETITVTGASPAVDVASSRTTEILDTGDLEQLPYSRTFSAFESMLPAVRQNATQSRRDVGGTAAEPPTGMQVHGSDPGLSSIDGIQIISMANASWRFFSNNANMTQEAVVELGNGAAEARTGGVNVNVISRDGGNVISGNVTGDWSGSGWDTNNLNDGLRARGITNTNKLRNIYDTGAGVGGPLMRNKLWFYGAGRRWGTGSFLAGRFFNKTPHTLFYTEDLDTPAFVDRKLWNGDFRISWQAAQQHKIVFQHNHTYECFCPQGPDIPSFGTPSGGYQYDFGPQFITRGDWTFTPNSRLLIQARVAYRDDSGHSSPWDNVNRDDRAILELSQGIQYGSFGLCLTCQSAYQDTPSAQRIAGGSLSYVTGSHSFKTGVGFMNAFQQAGGEPNFPDTYFFFFQRPVAIYSFASPHAQRTEMDMVLEMFAQDSWTLDQLTLNLGVRYDSMRGSSPAQTRPGGFYLGETFFAEQKDTPNWKSIHPRLGASYDVFGTGRTAVKASLGRYELSTNYDLSFARASSPMGALTTQTTRDWFDADGDFVPDCDLKNGAANGECGIWADQNFGSTRPVTQFSDDVREGWNVSPYLWQSQLSLQHELAQNVSLTVGYYRTWYGNKTTNDNTAVTAADFDPYCITVPTDARLPSGGGGEACGFFDVSFEKRGQVSNLNVHVDRTQVYNGFDILLNARLPQGAILFGGLNTGQTVTDNCPSPDAPAAWCKRTMPWHGDTAFKMSGMYPIPWQDIQAAFTYQNLPGSAQGTSASIANAAIAPSLGRNLSSCAAPTGPCRSRATLTIIEPLTQFEDRQHQLDLRFSKVFVLAGTARLQGNFDFYNVTNASDVLTMTTRLGPSYFNARSIMPGRLMKVGGQLSW